MIHRSHKQHPKDPTEVSETQSDSGDGGGHDREDRDRNLQSDYKIPSLLLSVCIKIYNLIIDVLLDFVL